MKSGDLVTVRACQWRHTVSVEKSNLDPLFYSMQSKTLQHLEMVHKNTETCALTAEYILFNCKGKMVISWLDDSYQMTMLLTTIS